MGFRLLLYLGILIVGGIIGYKELGNKKIVGKLNLIQSFFLLFLLFIMGVKMGLDRNVVLSFIQLGYQAIIISLFSIVFSVALVKAVKGYVLKQSEKEDNRVEF